MEIELWEFNYDSRDNRMEKVNLKRQFEKIVESYFLYYFNYYKPNSINNILWGLPEFYYFRRNVRENISYLRKI